MGEVTKISWADATWNPFWGCSEVSPACDHCYARELAKRFGFNIWGADADRRFFGPKHWREPVKWNREAMATFGRRMRVFCASMADVYEVNPKVDSERLRLFELIRNTPNLEWLLLTKRHAEIKRYMHISELPNVRQGVTVENQTYDFRIVPGVEWLSVEPMLGPLDLFNHLYRRIAVSEMPGSALNDGCTEGYERKPGINHVIIGGESGHGAREMKLEWALSLIAQCRAAGLAVHFKQTGDVLARKLGLKDKSGKDPAEWPIELQIQEFPKAKDQP